MYLLRFIKSAPLESMRMLLAMAVVGGISNALLLGMVNSAAEKVAQGSGISFRLLLLYGIAFAAYLVANRDALRRTNQLGEQKLHEIRLSIADKIAHSELRTLEGLGRGELYTKFCNECNGLSQLIPILVNSAQLAVLLVFCAVYVAFTSGAALIVLVLVTAVGGVAFWRYRSALSRAMLEVSASEAETLDGLADFVDGFSEIRLNARRNDALFGHFGGVVDRLHDRLVGIGEGWSFLLMFANAYIYGLLAAFVFLLPATLHGYDDVIHKVVAIALFSVAPLASLVFVSPMFTRAEVSLHHIYRLEELLEAGPRVDPEQLRIDVEALADFRTINYRDIGFSYRDKDGRADFTSGPWTVRLRRGELLFVTGGNGSGKSTMLKLLTGLYAPDTGRVLVDDRPLEGEGRLALGELFSCIFGDFHLFDRLYGLEHVEQDRVRTLLERMGLADKVSYADGRFSTLSLSTGQRKRLALVEVWLEDRPIIVFDEWAADQDGHFRELFYTSILPELKAAGKTIVAVTHDDRYWHLCDRLLKLEMGEIAQVVES